MNVVVIGAGVAGLSIGWRLRQAGAEVTVLERAQPGRGATWASAGMIAATAEAGESNMPETSLARRSALAWPHFAREMEEASGTEVGYRVSGTLTIARTVEEARVLQGRAQGSPGLEFLLPEAAQSLEPLLAHDIAGALFDVTEAQVDNRALGAALRIAFQRAGGALQTNEAAVRIEVEQGRAMAARTPFHVYGADAFVLAAGAWSGRIEGLPPDAVPPIVPVKGEMIALASARDPLPERMVWGDGIYLVPRRERLLAGATVTREGFDTRLTRQAAEWLFERAAALMPALTQWELVEHWAGLRPGSPDGLPLIGPSTLPGLFIASGQFRNGILFAPALADSMRDILLRQAAPDPAFDPCRFAKKSSTP